MFTAKMQCSRPHSIQIQLFRKTGHEFPLKDTGVATVPNAVQVGLLSIEDKLLPYFADVLPEGAEPSYYMTELTIRDTLRMATGHVTEPSMQEEGKLNWVYQFLTTYVEKKPGTHYLYNTSATYMLSALIQKLTGQTVEEYLTPRLFEPLGFGEYLWEKSPEGISVGGSGFNLRTEDIAKFGVFLRNRGSYGGKQLLDPNWIDEATAKQIDFVNHMNIDSRQGYGYQFWCNYREGFRGDGAFGQLCVVLPEHNMVFAIQTELGDMQREMDAVMELAEHLFDADDTASVILPAYEAVGSAQKTAGFENTFYRLEENPMGWSGVYFVYDTASDEMQAIFSDGTDQYVLRAGNGHWAESLIAAKKLKPKLVDLMSTPDKERCRTAASYTAEEGQLTFRVRYLNCPHRMVYTFTADGDLLKLRFENRGLLDLDAAELTSHRC